MIAIIKTGGKQYGIQEGNRLKIEKLVGEVGDTLTFSEVLFVGDETSVKAGTPFLAKASVTAKILVQDKADKVWGIKHKPKKRYKVKFGHRQPYTEIEIVKISA